jgi:hypothetical protein
MQPEDPQVLPAVTILLLSDDGEQPLGSGLLVGSTVVLADETLSRDLYDRDDLFPGADDDFRVLFDATTTAREPGRPSFVAVLGDAERGERIEVCEVGRSRGTPRPWVGFGLTEGSALPLSELPEAAREGLDEGPLEGGNPLCRLMPKFCR